MEPRLLQVVSVIVLWAEQRKTITLLARTGFCFVRIHSRRIITFI